MFAGDQFHIRLVCVTGDPCWKSQSDYINNVFIKQKLCESVNSELVFDPKVKCSSGVRRGERKKLKKLYLSVAEKSLFSSFKLIIHDGCFHIRA